MGFSRQEYWRELPFLSPGIFPPQGLNLHLLHWQADSLPWATWEGPVVCRVLEAKLGQEGGAKDSRMDRSVPQTWTQEGAERRADTSCPAQPGGCSGRVRARRRGSRLPEVKWLGGHGRLYLGQYKVWRKHRLPGAASSDPESPYLTRLHS